MSGEREPRAEGRGTGVRRGAALAACLLLPVLLTPAPGSAPPRAARAAPGTSPDGAPAAGEAAGPRRAVRAGMVAAAVRDSGGWRFPVGERAEYDVTFGPMKVGTGVLAVEAIEPVEGRPTYRVVLRMSGGPFFYKVDDRKESWIAPDPIRTLRFRERLREGDYRRNRLYRLDQEEGHYTRLDYDERSGEYRPVEEEREVPMPSAALDEVAYLYLVRTLPLEVGRTYRFERYFEEEGNPVVLHVLRRETVRVNAGRFETVVVRPVIQTSGLFAEGGRAEVFLSDDARRLVVQLKTRMKAGQVNMYLRHYRPGDVEAGFIAPRSEAEAAAGRESR